MLPLCVAMSLLKVLLKVDHDTGDVGAGAGSGSWAERASAEPSDGEGMKYSRNSSSLSNSRLAMSCTYAALVHPLLEGLR